MRVFEARRLKPADLPIQQRTKFELVKQPNGSKAARPHRAIQPLVSRHV
jgi:hypothetical protein